MEPALNLIESGIFGVSEAAALIGATERKVRGWVTGYKSAGIGPLIDNEIGWLDGRLAFSFTNLMEIRFVPSIACAMQCECPDSLVCKRVCEQSGIVKRRPSRKQQLKRHGGRAKTLPRRINRCNDNQLAANAFAPHQCKLRCVGTFSGYRLH